MLSTLRTKRSIFDVLARRQDRRSVEFSGVPWDANHRCKQCVSGKRIRAGGNHPALKNAWQDQLEHPAILEVKARVEGQVLYRGYLVRHPLRRVGTQEPQRTLAESRSSSGHPHSRRRPLETFNVSEKTYADPCIAVCHLLMVIGYSGHRLKASCRPISMSMCNDETATFGRLRFVSQVF